MAAYGLREAAHRAGLTESRLAEFQAIGAVTPSADDGFTEGDVRRAVAVQNFVDAGIPIGTVAQAIATGAMSLDFLDSQEYARMAATANETFAAVVERTQVPFELLTALRESTGAPAPQPDDYVRENELSAVPYLQTALGVGISAESVARHVRVMGDGLRRVAETESDIWYRELILPTLEAGGSGESALPEDSHNLADLGDEMLIAILHGRQAHAWMTNVVRGYSEQMARLGLHQPAQRSPTMCFIDVTGYTRMTAQRGDAAAAQVAEQLARLVGRIAAAHGGTPVKWLGDGVMVHFEDARGAVTGAVEMLPAIGDAGLPPAHVGMHSGEVHFSQGDYFGQTVNLSARIADFARPGEVLVSADTVAAAGSVEGVRFELIGPVELKGVEEPVELHIARPEQ